ncbi:PAS domain-containing sensor histidine kinase [uncultured Roseovarius sp.]|uniref:PAS domain-containing sensor histidine kinase n=1 Tax=uncultured Roseovarius sp. TaxID=293344 RepID=UPI0025D20755|nr:PAS domain-containing sensor histidine kinase [uncultured Roseovarius sp.]
MQQKVKSPNHLDVVTTPPSKQTADPSFLEAVLEDLQHEVYVYCCETLRIRYVNQAARHRVGWSLQDASSKTICDTVATFDIDAFHRKTAALLDGSQAELTVELTFPTGPIEVTTKLVTIAGEGSFFVSTVRDLADRKSLENAKLQTVSTVSHELRTPLTSIHGALRLLKAGVIAKLDDQTHSVVDIASRNTDRLLSIVNDILDFEKIKCNKMDFSINEMDLVQCLRDTVELVSGVAAEHEVTLEIDNCLTSATVLGNADRMGQVITNFASNAIKYSPKGGTVKFSIAQEDRSIIFSVTDQGPGIAPEEQRALFKPFSQARASDGSNRPGTGLGLAIVAAILQRLEYPVAVISDVGRGSTFSFRVPAHLVIETQTSCKTRAGTI